MRTSVCYLVVLMLLAACSSTKTFPVSDLVPAAEITVKQNKNNNDNNEITVKAKHLASPDRVSKQASTYVVWLVSEENGLQNIGAIYNKNGENEKLETITPFKGTEIFITAEEEASITRPQGVEITRMKL